MLHRRRAALVGLIVYAAALSCVLPWTYRNYRVFDGRFVLVSNNGGINLLISNMPGSWGKQGLMWNKELHTIITTTDDEIVRDNAARAAFLDYASHHAGELAAALPHKLLALYAADVDGFGWNQAGVRNQLASGVWLPMRIVAQAYYIMILALAIACIWHFRKSRAPNLRAGPVVFLYITAVCLFFTGGPRFHFPVVPWIASYAAGLVAAWLTQRPASARSTLHSDPISSAPPPWPGPQPLTPDAPHVTVPSRDA